MNRSALLRAVVAAMPGLTTAGVAQRAGLANNETNHLLHGMKNRGHIGYIPPTTPHGAGTWYPITTVVERGPYQPRGARNQAVLASVTDTLRTTNEVAAAAGVTRVQAKDTLRGLAARGLVRQVRGKWDSWWCLAHVDEPRLDEHDEPWTPQPWVHPIRARAMGASLSTTSR